MDEAFIAYLKCVGTGPKHNRDLTPEEMADAMERILTQRASSEQIAAFLLGWRLKPESTDELKTALGVLDRHTHQTPIADVIELGYPFDGKNDEPYLFPLVAPLLEPLGISLLLYGGQRQPSKEGLTTHEVCHAITPIQNIHYLDQSDYAPALAALSSLRQALGLRTALNTLERLPNTAKAQSAAIGVFHKPFVTKYAEIFAPRYERLAIVKGSEGTPEIFGRCRAWLCREGACEEYRIDPARYGIEIEKNFVKRPHAQLLDQTRNPSDHLLALARLNAAFLAFAYGKAKDIDEGWEMLGG